METIIAWLLSMFIALFSGAGSTGVAIDPDPTVDEITTAEVVSVVDGDTIKVNIEGEEMTVRYIGIDTPEPYRDGEPACFSGEATAFNESLVAGQTVELRADVEDRDRYNRLLRYVYIDGVFVNETLIQEGYATILPIKPNISHATDFKTAEAEARAAGRGLWSACHGTLAQGEVVATDETEAVVIESTDLPAGQQRILDWLGLDTQTFTVTKDMILCAEQAVGVDRLATIIAGDIPSIAEGIQLLRCYQS